MMPPNRVLARPDGTADPRTRLGEALLLFATETLAERGVEGASRATVNAMLLGLEIGVLFGRDDAELAERVARSSWEIARRLGQPQRERTATDLADRLAAQTRKLAERLDQEQQGH